MTTKIKTMLKALTAVSTFALSFSAAAGSIEFKDPKGDDIGAGHVVYPTDGVYKPGSFDLKKFIVKSDSKKATFTAELNTTLEDTWGMGSGFAIQMIFVYIDTKPGGHTDSVPGTNVTFASGSEWDKVVILSPQKQSRVISEAQVKAPNILSDIVVPSRTKGKGKKITGKINLADLGEGDPTTWGYQVVVQSNEGFPAKTDLLTRKVNEYEGQHRFGGQADTDCDPHVLDVLAGDGKGKKSEIAAQIEMLKFECSEDGEIVKLSELSMLRKSK